MPTGDTHLTIVVDQDCWLTKYFYGRQGTHNIKLTGDTQLPTGDTHLTIVVDQDCWLTK
jgi:hypothetical protein